MTVARALALGIRRLAASESPRADASRLLGAALGRDAAWLLAHDDAPLGAAEAPYLASLARRERGEPVAYVLGEAGFRGLAFAVSRAVLVPRPESEALVELAVAHLREREDPRARDAGTGSGALAVAIAHALPRARVDATDVSGAALAVARANAARHGVAARVRFALASVLEGPRGPYDAIVANLPYLRTDELPAAPDPVSHEPALALDGGPDGLALYRALLARAPAALAPGGLLAMEAGAESTDALGALAAAAFPGASVEVLADYAGLPRVVAVRARAGAGGAPRPPNPPHP